MPASIIQGLFESIGEIIFLSLGVRRALALIFFALGLLTLGTGKYESCGIFLAMGFSVWDAYARRRRSSNL
jgi:hypothetical protein